MREGGKEKTSYIQECVCTCKSMPLELNSDMQGTHVVLSKIHVYIMGKCGGRGGG